jgi:hypothetical protein
MRLGLLFMLRSNETINFALVKKDSKLVGFSFLKIVSNEPEGPWR